MKRLVPIITMVALAMLIGCEGKGSTSIAGIPINISRYQNKRHITQLDMEAAKIALDLWKPTKIGQSYYVQVIKSDSNNTVMERTIIEFRNGQVEIGGGEAVVSYADKLNGIEWWGGLSFIARDHVIRTYSPQRAPLGPTEGPPDTTWSQWTNDTDHNYEYMNNQVDAKLIKTKGIWRLEEHRDWRGGPQIKDYWFTSFKQVEASDLPK